MSVVVAADAVKVAVPVAVFVYVVVVVAIWSEGCSLLLLLPMQ